MEQQILDELRAIRLLLERIEINTRKPIYYTTIKSPTVELYPRWFEVTTGTAVLNPPHNISK